MSTRTSVLQNRQRFRRRMSIECRSLASRRLFGPLSTRKDDRLVVCARPRSMTHQLDSICVVRNLQLLHGLSKLLPRCHTRFLPARDRDHLGAHGRSNTDELLRSALCRAVMSEALKRCYQCAEISGIFSKYSLVFAAWMISLRVEFYWT